MCEGAFCGFRVGHQSSLQPLVFIFSYFEFKKCPYLNHSELRLIRLVSIKGSQFHPVAAFLDNLDVNISAT